MRWQALFADLEAQFDAAEQAELAAEVADRTRREAARLRLVDRLRAAESSWIDLGVTGVGVIRGRLDAMGADWVLLTEPPAREALVPLAAVAWVGGLTLWSSEPDSEGVVAGRLGIGHALRGLARDRALASVTLVDGSTLRGTIDRVGRDFVELSEARDDGGRRGPVRAVPHAAICVVRSG